LQVSATSDPGLSGKQNEDRYGVAAFYTDSTGQTPALLAIVADGIGGHRAGEVAAELAVETISQIMSEGEATEPILTLQRAIVRAGQLIKEKADTEPVFEGMGSTVACTWVIGRRLYTASVGDTRIYLVRNHTINQVTTDHTWVEEAIANGTLRREQARDHPNAHIIRRYLGSKQDVIPDTRLRLSPNESDSHAEANQGSLLEPGDLLILCTDGLTDLVEDNEILSIVETRNADNALDELVRLANQRGGHDNITIVMLRVPTLERATIPIETRIQRNRWITACLVVIGLMLIGVLISMGLVYYRNSLTPTIQPSESTSTLVSEASLIPAITVTSTPEPPTATIPTSTSVDLEITSTPNPSSTPLQVTLTPWPTNTQASP